MHGAAEERRVFSFDEELALQEGGRCKGMGMGTVKPPVFHVGRGGRGNEVVAARRK